MDMVNNYWQAHNINKIYAALYKSRSHGAVQGFIKIIQRRLAKAYYNLKDNGKRLFVGNEFNLLLCFYNRNQKLS